MSVSGMSRTSDDLDTRRRKVLYHSWHRGTREMDLLLGRYAEAHIADFSDDDLTAFEALMEETDRDLFGWILGTVETPPQYQAGLMPGIIAFAKAHPLTD